MMIAYLHLCVWQMQKAGFLMMRLLFHLAAYMDDATVLCICHTFAHVFEI